jgi:hypothetical protein
MFNELELAQIAQGRLDALLSREKTMSETLENRQSSDRRFEDRRSFERRLRAFEERSASSAGHCAFLDALITPDGCRKIRRHNASPALCADCPGVFAERRMLQRRRIQRRLGKDRRKCQIHA